MLLVTGGAGYIGSHFVHEFLRTHDEPVVVVDNLSEGHREAIKNLKVDFVEANVGDQDALNKVFEKFKVDAVVHFAANAYVGESHELPFKYFHNNVVQTINLFEVMEKHGVRNIVFSSTCATYGFPEYVPIDEKHPQRPVNVYGTTKLIVENVLKALGDAKQWSFIALRYFNAAGAAEDGSLGESHDPETHLIPLVLKTAAGQQSHVTILGDDYETRDGTCIRDYVHVTDLATAHCQALDLLRSKRMAEFINLGTEHGASVLEVIATSEEVTGKKIERKVAPRRPGDPPMLVANSAKASSVLGWSPKYGLKEIIETAWRWEENRQF